MAKYNILKCDVCNRQIDRIIDPLRPLITKCNITNKCTGTLSVIGTTNVKTPVAPVRDVDDWVNRNHVDTTEFINKPITKSLLNGNGTMCTMVNNNLSIGSSFELSVDISGGNVIDPIDYIYDRPAGIYRFGGTDDSPGKQTLRFSESDEVSVFINGIRTTAFTTANNNIILTIPLDSNENHIKVSVYKISRITTTNLLFEKQEEFTSAWGNAKEVDVLVGNNLTDTYDVYICNDISNLKINTHFYLSSVQPFTTGAYLLLSDEPWTHIDRDLNGYIDINDLNTTGAQRAIVYELDSTGEPVMSVDSAAVVDVFPPLIISSKYSADKVGNQVSNFNNKRTFRYIN